MDNTSSITVAYGDGIGPEIMNATLLVLGAAGAKLEVETIKVGEAVYYRGHTSGIEPSSWDSLRRTKVFLKGPITTPQGGGYKSLNVTIRKSLGLYTNIRPCVSYHPFITTRHPGMDVVVIRENEEDLYAGIEHRQTDEVVQCLKLISRPGCERIVRFAFEYARVHARKKVTCLSKDNIMKMTDGLFHKTFAAIGAEYPQIAKEHLIVDIGSARLADTPGRFDVIVTQNLYGDIITDIAAQMTGSVGLAGSANIGESMAMFEAIHGSAPDIAGRGIANPSGLLLGAVMMLVHLGQTEVAQKIHNAWLKTIEDGTHTPDIYHQGVSRQRVGTQEFAEAVIARLGQYPDQLKPVCYASEGLKMELPAYVPRPAAHKQLVGVDVFLHLATADVAGLAERLAASKLDGLELQMISNRGVKVWPDGFPETLLTDHWRCRYLGSEGSTLPHRTVLELLGRLEQAGFDFIKTKHLYTFDGEPGYSLVQGQ